MLWRFVWPKSRITSHTHSFQNNLMMDIFFNWKKYTFVWTMYCCIVWAMRWIWIWLWIWIWKSLNINHNLAFFIDYLDTGTIWQQLPNSTLPFRRSFFVWHVHDFRTLVQMMSSLSCAFKVSKTLLTWKAAVISWLPLMEGFVGMDRLQEWKENDVDSWDFEYPWESRGTCDSFMLRLVGGPY